MWPCQPALRRHSALNVLLVPHPGRVGSLLRTASVDWPAHSHLHLPLISSAWRSWELRSPLSRHPPGASARRPPRPMHICRYRHHHQLLLPRLLLLLPRLLLRARLPVQPARTRARRSGAGAAAAGAALPRGAGGRHCKCLGWHLRGDSNRGRLKAARGRVSNTQLKQYSI